MTKRIVYDKKQFKKALLGKGPSKVSYKTFRALYYTLYGFELLKGDAHYKEILYMVQHYNSVLQASLKFAPSRPLTDTSSCPPNKSDLVQPCSLPIEDWKEDDYAFEKKVTGDEDESQVDLLMQDDPFDATASELRTTNQALRERVQIAEEENRTWQTWSEKMKAEFEARQQLKKQNWRINLASYMRKYRLGKTAKTRDIMLNHLQGWVEFLIRTRKAPTDLHCLEYIYGCDLAHSTAIARQSAINKFTDQYVYTRMEARKIVGCHKPENAPQMPQIHMDRLMQYLRAKVKGESISNKMLGLKDDEECKSQIATRTMDHETQVKDISLLLLMITGCRPNEVAYMLVNRANAFKWAPEISWHGEYQYRATMPKSETKTSHEYEWQFTAENSWLIERISKLKNVGLDREKFKKNLEWWFIRTMKLIRLPNYVKNSPINMRSVRKYRATEYVKLHTECLVMQDCEAPPNPLQHVTIYTTKHSYAAPGSDSKPKAVRRIIDRGQEHLLQEKYKPKKNQEIKREAQLPQAVQNTQ